MHRNRMRLLFPVLLCLFTLSLSGCPKDPYRAAIQGSSDVSQAVSSGIKITSSYYSAGTFNDSQKATAAGYFTIVTDCNMTFRKAIIDVHNSGQTGAAAYLTVGQSFVTCVQNSAPVVNDDKVKNVLKAVTAAVNGVQLAISQAKGGVK